MLDDGSIIILGGWWDSSTFATAVEINPTTLLWSRTTDLPQGRIRHTSTLLSDGQVLIAGGYGYQGGWTWLDDAWRYNPSTGMFTALAPMLSARAKYTSVKLQDGRVLVSGGTKSNTEFLAAAELFDPLSRQFVATEDMHLARSWHTSTLLDDGQVLIVGGQLNETQNSATVELGNFLPANTMTGTLVLPSGWYTSTHVPISITVDSLAASISDISLSNDGVNYGEWFAVANEIPLETAWSVQTDGIGKNIYLRLRDTNGRILPVVDGTVDVDSNAPSTTITALPALSPREIPISWLAIDNLSGVYAYDVEYRVNDGAWTNLLSRSTQTSTLFTGDYGSRYDFRARAIDSAGNIEDWAPSGATATLVFTLANPSFTAKSRSGPNPLSVQFQNTSTGDFIVSLWDFGDGFGSSEQSPTHIYANSGVYTVALEVTDFETSRSISQTDFIEVLEKTSAQFEAEPVSGMFPLTVGFRNLSTGDYSTILWNFGDGIQSGSDNPFHIYQYPGNYTVSLKANGLGGLDIITKTAYINVFEPVVANFSTDGAVGVAPHTVSFTNLSAGSFDTVNWDFGDSSQSSQNNPSHTYLNPGVYTVTLTATGGGGTDSAVQPNAVSVYSPVVVDSASPTAGIAPLGVQFQNLATGDYDSLVWNFGNGVQSNQVAPLVNYVQSGVYTVSLRATGLGGSSVITKSDFIRVYEPVIASFDVSPTIGIAPLSVSFTNTSTGDYRFSRWDYGDGFQTTLANPSHVYSQGGVYTVTLQVYGDGRVSTITKTNLITAYSKVVADFTSDKQSGGAPLTVAFTNRSKGDFDSAMWDFGDGTQSSQLNPQHTYDAIGSYTVTLSVIGNGGEDMSSYPNYINVFERVYAGFSASPTQGTAPLYVMFLNESLGSYDSLLWDFGDGYFSTLPNPTHAYTHGGKFTVSLTASGPGGEDIGIRENYVQVTGDLFLPMVVGNRP